MRSEDALKKKLLIFGTGSISEVASYYFETDSPYNIIGFIDTDVRAAEVAVHHGKPVFPISSILQDYPPETHEIFVAIGYRMTNQVRQKRLEELKSLGYKAANYISSRATILNKKIGENCFILENNVIQPFVEIGDNVTLWSGNHIGHHSIIKDNVFLASHIVISGKCVIGQNCFMGVNSTLHDGIEVGDFSVVGAGAILDKSCEARSVFVSQATPSRIIKRDII